MHTYKLLPKEHTAHHMEVRVHQNSDHITFEFRGEGSFSGLEWPPTKNNIEFTDNLWLATVFEIFFQDEGVDTYEEWNFSPSGNWAHYEFLKYREGMKAINKKGSPDIFIKEKSKESFHLIAKIPKKAVSAVKGEKKLGICAILLFEDGVRTHWALKHSSEKPDFHKSDTFAGSITLHS